METKLGHDGRRYYVFANEIKAETFFFSLDPFWQERFCICCYGGYCNAVGPR